MKRIALLGATSHVAKNLIFENYSNHRWDLSLFARNPDRIRAFLTELGLPQDAEPLGAFTNTTETFDAVINCVGFGTPQKVRAAQESLFTVAEEIDRYIFAHLRRNPQTKYLNFSSGAVYGSALESPIQRGALSSIALSPMDDTDSYRVSKIYQEAKHRSWKDFSVVDIRLFNFFSRFIDQDGGYLMTDVLRALKAGTPLKTSSQEIYRDYIAPSDLFRFVDKIVEGGTLNAALDTFSAKPISKSELLESLKREFGLKVELSDGGKASPTGVKPYYYSNDKGARAITGYVPQKTSWDGIFDELSALGLVPRLAH